MERLQKLRESFTSMLPNRLQIIDARWQAVKQCNIGYSVNIDELYQAIHSLAGSAGMFGHIQIGDAARQLKQILRLSLGNDKPITDANIQTIEIELNRLKELVK